MFSRKQLLQSALPASRHILPEGFFAAVLGVAEMRRDLFPFHRKVLPWGELNQT